MRLTRKKSTFFWGGVNIFPMPGFAAMKGITSYRINCPEFIHGFLPNAN